MQVSPRQAIKCERCDLRNCACGAVQLLEVLVATLVHDMSRCLKFACCGDFQVLARLLGVGLPVDVMCTCVVEWSNLDTFRMRPDVSKPGTTHQCKHSECIHKFVTLQA